MLGQTELKADWFSHVLFESPWMVIVVLALAWMCLRIVGRRTQNKRLTRASWAPLALIAVLFVVSEAVTTKKEKLLDALDAMLLAVEDGDTETFHGIVPTDATARLLGAEFTRGEIDLSLRESKIDDLTLLSLSAGIDEQGVGYTVIKVRADGEFRGVPGLEVTVWDVYWRYEGERWQAYRFENRSVGVDAMMGGP